MDAGMVINVAIAISAQQNRSGRGRVDSTTWRGLSAEQGNVVKMVKHKDWSMYSMYFYFSFDSGFVWMVFIQDSR